MDRLIEKIVDKQLKNGVISEEDIPVYRYGYLLLFEMLLNIVAGLIVGIMLGQIGIVIAFWLAYIPLRSYAGGWHASTFFRCFMVSLLSLIGALIIVRMDVIDSSGITTCVDAICTALIIILSPIDTQEKPLKDIEKRRYKRITVIILVIHALVSILMVKLRIMLLYVHVVLCMALIVQLVINNTQGMRKR